MSSITRICSIEDCSKPSMSYSWCSMHYTRWRRYGNTNPRPRLKSDLRLMPEYFVWLQMRFRCNNPNSPSYINYGGRGIAISDRWNGVDGFQNFILDLDWRPNSKYSLDRIDNNGNYEPSNCRWATKNQQQVNRRKSRTNTSGYIGVHWDYSKWEAKIKLDGKNFSLGRFFDIEQAALEYDKAVIFYRGSDGVTNLL